MSGSRELHDKKYQVFISSTYEDLVKERRAVEETVIISGDFPVQMESFPATDKDQFEFIKTLIDRCDYYVLIVAGRYGTVADDGFSYTEKEYRYAVEKGIPVLVMLHNNRGSLRADQTESSPEGRAKLEKFIQAISTGRVIKHWDNIDNLKLGVMTALSHAKEVHPRMGWVRGDSAASVEVLEELRKARKEIDKYEETIGKIHLDIPLPKIPDHNEYTQFSLIPVKDYHNNPEANIITVRCKWISIFPLLYTGLRLESPDFTFSGYGIKDTSTCISIGSSIASIISGLDTAGLYKITTETLDKFTAFFIETGFMLTEESDRPFTEHAERFARRLRIAYAEDASFELVKGRIVEALPQTSIDDDIPF